MSLLKRIGVLTCIASVSLIISFTVSAEETASNNLSQKEEKLFDALVDVTTEDFFEPSAVRILEVGDYNDRIKYSEKDDDLSQSLAEPDLVVVRLQGENKVGGTLNHYYKICIEGYEKTDDLSKKMIENLEEGIKIKEQLVAVNGALGKSSSSDYSDLMERKGRLMEFKAEAGDYIELEDSYTIEEDASETFDIGNINKALKAYWEDLGF